MNGELINIPTNSLVDMLFAILSRELIDKIRQEIVDKEQVVMHVSTDDSAMVKVGTLTSDGECIVNRVAPLRACHQQLCTCIFGNK
jgi:Lactate racemase N-terminal domain